MISKLLLTKLLLTWGLQFDVTVTLGRVSFKIMQRSAFTCTCAVDPDEVGPVAT